MSCSILQSAQVDLSACESQGIENKEMVLLDSERQPCEIWTRVMGYHRPLSSFNIGKKGEFHERCYFTENVAFNTKN